MWFATPAEAAPADVLTATVPAAGRQEHVFALPAFGRFAVSARSAQGTAVEVHDRMAGKLGSDGVSGERDGRVDLFADRGEVKVVAWPDPAASGEIVLSVAPFSAPPTPRRLDRGRLVETAIADLETRAWWVDLAENELVDVRAAGRHLGDLRLWRDGSWLVDAPPTCRAIEPRPGEPWTECSVTKTLEPGLYLVTAYGGPGKPWTTDRDSQPLDVQWGVEHLGTAGQRDGVLPESGIARFVPGDNVDTFHVALSEVAKLQVSGSGWSGGSITPESRRPTATARNSSAKPAEIAITGVPGQPYTMTWFRSGRELVIPGPGSFWVASLSTVDPADSPPVTALVYQGRVNQPGTRREFTQALVASSTTFVQERFNLPTQAELLVDVTEAGPYVFWVEGTTADLMLEPYLVSGSVAPNPAARGELHLDIQPGVYRLYVTPVEPGIATLSIGYDSYAARAARTAGTGPAPSVFRPDLQVPEVVVETNQHRTVAYLRGGDGVTGVVARKLPIDAVDPLPLSLLGAETVEVPLDVFEPGVLRVTSTTGDPLPFSVDAGFLETEHAMEPGAHRVRVTNPTSAPIRAALAIVPDRFDPEHPLPELGAERLAAIPSYPRLGVGSPLGVELGGGKPAATAILGVDGDGLWIVASDGLLATQGSVRTRILPSLATASTNGAGRNFEIARYLRSGDYQVTATALGASAGHARLTLVKAPITDGGAIVDPTPARVTLQPGEAVRHELVVTTAGEYHVRHAGRTRSFRCRLEDDDGWTVTGGPDQDCDLTLWLDPGRYALVGLPERVETRRTTVVEPASVPDELRTGHGPFALGLGLTARHVWVEPKDRAGERPPDVWTLEVPAAVGVRIALSDEMAGEVVRPDRPAERIVPGQPWTGTLPQGTVRLELRGARRGTGVPYTVSVEPRSLVAGTERPVDGEERVPVAIGTAGLYAFESRGDADVQARLFLGDTLVAANDDRPDDWNFRLVTRLEPGDYTLAVGAFGQSYGWSTSVALERPREVDAGTVRSGDTRTLRPGDDALLVGLVDRTAEVVVAQVTSGDNSGVAIEVETPDGWRTLAVGTGRDAVAVAWVDDRDAELRLRVWSEDRRGSPVGLVARGVLAHRAGLEGSVSVGKAFEALQTAGGAGQFTLGVTEGVWACPDPFPRGTGACLPGRQGLMAGGEDGLVLVRRAGQAQATRVVVEDGQAASVRLGRDERAVDVGKGLVAVSIRSATGEVRARAEDGAGLPGPQSALVVTDDALVRLAAEGGTGDTDARVEVHELDDGGMLPATEGATPVELPPYATWSVGLPGARNVVVHLDAGTAVRSGDGRGAWANPAATSVHLDGASGPLRIVNPTGERKLVRVEVNPLAGNAALVHGGPHEALRPAAGTWVLPVPADADGTLHALGTVRATFVGTDGRIVGGDDIPVGDGGTLILDASPGPVLAWVAHPGETGPARPGADGATARITGSSVVPLSGDAVRVQLAPPRAMVVSLVAPCPLVAEVSAGWSRTEVLAAGDRLDVAVLDAGKPASVRLRALAGAALYGELVATASIPGSLAEGVGPEVLLGPGGAAFFQLEVTREGAIGLGARAEADRVDSVLYDATGKRLASGRLLMRDLTPGTWLVALSQPPGSPPLRASPVVVGLERPPEGPPADVVRRYVGGEEPEREIVEWDEARWDGEGGSEEGGEEGSYEEGGE